MADILLLNSISDVVHNYLPKDKFNLTKESDQPVGILVRSADMKSYARPASLLAIARAGAGVNNIPCEDCANEGIVVFNTPGANANSVKELMLASMIAASRNMFDAVEWAATLKGKGAEVPKLVEKGKGQFSGHEIKGKKLGVIGLGAIGGLIANDAHNLGMDVLGFDAYLSVDTAWRLSRGIQKANSPAQIYQECDYITLHVPLTPETKGMINKEALAMMKPGVTILNFSRDGLVDSAAMLEALDSGKVAKYVVDFPTDEMLGHKNVICIPHLGASTAESEDNCAAMAAEQLADYILYGNIKNSVNFPTVELPYTGRTRLCMAHKNIANLLGQITAVIAADHINISDMINKSKGDIAYTIIDTDSEITPHAIEAIKNITGMIRVRVI